MSSKTSRDELITFLDYLGQKGFIPLATANARKASVKQVLSVLSDSEADDVTQLDINDVMTKFGHLHGKKYSQGSVSTYKSRLQSSLDDFKRYLENPMGFRVMRPAKDGNGAKVKKAKLRKPLPSSTLDSEGSQAPVSNSSTPNELANILPIPLRSDLTIHIRGLPFDLTKAEAERIANVVIAMAVVVK
jgi:site-specific recombinase XerD